MPAPAPLMRALASVALIGALRAPAAAAAVARVTPVDVLTSGLASMTRLQYGAQVSDAAAARAAAPALAPLTLYEFEACPFCRRVREAVTYLDLALTVKPCGRGSRHRDEVVARGGKAQFPYLVDEASGAALYESADIVRYLLEAYGEGAGLPSEDFLDGGAAALGAALPSLLRFGRGAAVAGGGEGGASARAPPAQPLQLWSYEANQFCRLVREALCELDLPYVLYSAGKGSPRRAQLRELTGGSSQCPYLLDPNTGAAMAESKAIVDYLVDTYGARAA